ncbi:MAG TPA: VCBS repeat-containing protein [Ignavibacteriaceae bacterium]
MKKEDMKKHLLGEKIGLKIELNAVSFLFLFFFLPFEVLPQIPINGFCKLNLYQFSPGYSKIFSLNYNSDSYSDLILYDPSLKKMAAISGEKNERFAKEEYFDFPFHISNLAPIREKNNEIKKYAFTSRKNLTAGICEFSSDGKPRVTHQLNFKSYPEKLSTADIDGDFHQEILLSGSAFEGLSILNFEGKNLNERIVKSKGSYSQAIFINLSNDGFPDIAAINLLNNSLEFLFNDGRGNFKVVRTMNFYNKVRNLHSFDMDLDSYHDLVFLEGNKLKIMYGDFQSSYSKQIEIETKYPPNDFIIGDFNKDGNIDFAYLNTDVSIVSVVFAESDYKFFAEIPILYKEGIKNIIPFYSKFIDGLAIISDDGALLTNTVLSSMSPNIDISLSIKPTVISNFDANSDAINDICFIDSFDRSLKLVVRSNAGIPSNYFSIPLHGNPNQIAFKNFSKQSTTFFCYSVSKKLVEVIEVEFNTGKITRSEFYTARPIADVKPVLNDHQMVFVSSLVNNRLTLEIFEKEESWKLLADYNISEKAISADLSTLRGVKLFFWNQIGDSIKLFKKTFLPEEMKAEFLLNIKMKNISNFLTVVDDFHNLDKESIISFVESDEKPYILVSHDGSVNSFDVEEVKKNLIVRDLNQLFVSEIKPNGTRRLIVNNYNSQNIYRLNILRKGKKIVFSKIIDKINTEKFFVRNMTVNNYHLVYLNQTKECISIRQI